MKALNSLTISEEARDLEVMNHEARRRIEELEAELKRRDEAIESIRRLDRYIHSS